MSLLWQLKTFDSSWSTILNRRFVPSVVKIELLSFVKWVYWDLLLQICNIGSISTNCYIQLFSTSEWQKWVLVFQELDANFCHELFKIAQSLFLQGVRGQSGFSNWALRERNIQVKLYLKVVLKSWDVDILIIKTNFQKINIGWPQQPPTEKMQKLENYVSLFH